MDSLIRTYVWAVLITGILGMPVLRTHIQEGPNLFVAKGSAINLTCIISPNVSQLAVTWFQDGKQIDLDMTREGVQVTMENGSNPVSHLQIQNAGSTDTGKYTCQPNPGDSADIWVYVLDGTISAPLEPLNSTNEFVCAYKGEFYPLGAFIYPDEDPCIVCECNGNHWNSSCYRKECLMEKNKHHLDAGCVPVYQEKECCPVEYYCPKTVDDSSREIIVTPNEDSSENGDKCYFAGKAYNVGSDIPVNNSCIKCRCNTPPGPTCVRKSCPPNTENCPSSYSENECCPIYNCILEDENIDGTTENIYTNCPTPLCTDKTCVIGVSPGQQCPTCICDGNCPTPLCADKSCVIGVPPGHQCPTCICDGASSENDLEVSHEKNDLEPSFEELDPRFGERYNETQTLNNEIESQVLSKNYSERESLSSEFGEDIQQKGKFEGEGTRGPKSAPKISLLNEEESNFNETEFELGLTTMQYDTHKEENDNSTSNTHELRQKRSRNSETAGIQSQYSQQQWNILQEEDQFIEGEDSGENSERELEGNEDDYSEMAILRTRNSQKPHDELVELEENELENVVWTSEVAGCPAPMCADSTCRIGIPQGHTCPTCVCIKKRRQP